LRINENGSKTNYFEIRRAYSGPFRVVGTIVGPKTVCFYK
jgi:hypothetical protein